MAKPTILVPLCVRADTVSTTRLRRYLKTPHLSRRITNLKNLHIGFLQAITHALRYRLSDLRVQGKEMWSGMGL